MTVDLLNNTLSSFVTIHHQRVAYDNILLYGLNAKLISFRNRLCGFHVSSRLHHLYRCCERLGNEWSKPWRFLNEIVVRYWSVLIVTVQLGKKW